MAQVVLVILLVAAVVVAAYLLTPVPRRSPLAQAELDGAVAQIDQELAADLELMSMFDQTRQAFVLENARFLATREIIQRELPAAFALVADVYERIPETETSMERRGPAGSVPETDRARVLAWEGDAREGQRVLRAAARPERVPRWRLLRERLGGRHAASR